MHFMRSNNIQSMVVQALMEKKPKRINLSKMICGRGGLRMGFGPKLYLQI